MSTAEPSAPFAKSGATTAPALKKLGRYEIVAELGRGAMGTVYHGLDATIERSVALKTLNPELPQEILAEVKERFLREAKSAGRLNHPNIVTIYEFGEDAGTAFIAMEFLEGKSLQDVMRGGRLPFATIASIVAQVADALDYANRFGIVHRDIKPANIMIAPHGLAKLTDFGIARLQSSSMTQTGAMLGSPKYMSPEQVLGQPADGRADIFSLGVVLYEMLASYTPFETPEVTVFSLMQRIVTFQQQPIVEAVPGTPPAFDAMLARALAKKVGDRYQRAADFANDLRNFSMMTTGVPGTALGAVPAAASMAASTPGGPVANAAGGVVVNPAGGAADSTAASPASGTQVYERTHVTHPGAGKAPAHSTAAAAAPAPVHAQTGMSAGIDPAFAVTMAAAPPKALLGDLDTLGDDIDAMQEKFLAEETAALRSRFGGAGKSSDWDRVTGAIEAPPPELPMASASSTGVKKSSVFGLVRQQTGPNLKEQAEAKRAAEAAALIAFDAKLRAAYAFLLELFREANQTNPQYAGAHTLPYFGACPPLFFANGTVNARMKRIEDGGKLKDITDHLIVSYQLTSNQARRIAVNALELPKFRALLKEHEMKFTVAETLNDFKQVTRAVFELEVKFICAITVRADYANQTAELSCRNAGPIGRKRYLVPSAMMNDLLWEELSKLILGYPSPMMERFAVAL